MLTASVTELNNMPVRLRARLLVGPPGSVQGVPKTPLAIPVPALLTVLLRIEPYSAFIIEMPVRLLISACVRLPKSVPMFLTVELRTTGIAVLLSCENDLLATSEIVIPLYQMFCTVTPVIVSEPVLPPKS